MRKMSLWKTALAGTLSAAMLLTSVPVLAEEVPAATEAVEEDSVLDEEVLEEDVLEEDTTKDIGVTEEAAPSELFDDAEAAGALLFDDGDEDGSTDNEDAGTHDSIETAIEIYRTYLPETNAYQYNISRDIAAGETIYFKLVSTEDSDYTFSSQLPENLTIQFIDRDNNVILSEDEDSIHLCENPPYFMIVTNPTDELVSFHLTLSPYSYTSSSDSRLTTYSVDELNFSTIGLNDTRQITNPLSIFAFTAPETRNYLIVSDYAVPELYVDSYVYIYDAPVTDLTSYMDDDDDGGTHYYFKYLLNAEAGHTYYIYPTYYDLEENIAPYNFAVTIPSVNNSFSTAAVAKKEDSTYYASADLPVDPGATAFFKITPSETTTYAISADSEDLNLVLYNSNGTSLPLTTDVDEDEDTYNNANLIAGQTYYVALTNMSDYSRNISLRIYKNSDHTHTFGAWQTQTLPTALATGVSIRYCTTGDGAYETVATAKLSPYITMNVANGASVPLKVKQKSTAIKVTGLQTGDAVASWTSSNTKVVTVDSKGKLTGKKKGTATITVTSQAGATYSFKVKVQKGAVKTKKVTVASKKVALTKGQKFDLSAAISPLTSAQKLSYSTSKKSVATVKKGVITAKKKGSATITVKSGSKKVKIKVTVK